MFSIYMILLRNRNWHGSGIRNVRQYRHRETQENDMTSPKLMMWMMAFVTVLGIGMTWMALYLA